MAVLIHNIHSSLNADMWNRGLEVSFDKLYKRIQERAFSLLRHMLTTITVAVKQFLLEINRVPPVSVCDRFFCQRGGVNANRACACWSIRERICRRLSFGKRGYVFFMRSVEVR